MPPASEPECTPVSAKHGTSSPLARRPRYFSFCSGVPYFSSNSPGPSELGTITVIPAATERLAILETIIDCACARKPSPPCSLAISMPRKPLSLRYCQSSGRQVGAVVADVPVVDHRADDFGLVVEKCLLLRGQRQRANGIELAPVRPARKQFGIPADGAGIERFLLGAADARQDGFDGAIDRRDQHRLADRLDAEHQHDRAEHQDQPAAETQPIADAAPPENRARDSSPITSDRHAPLPQRTFPHGQNRKDDKADDDKRKSHGSALHGVACRRAQPDPERQTSRRIARLGHWACRAGIIAPAALIVEVSLA